MIPNWIGTIRSAIGLTKIRMTPNWIRIITITIDSSKRTNPCLKSKISARFQRTGGSGSLNMPEAISTCCLWMYTSSYWVSIESWSSEKRNHSQTEYILYYIYSFNFETYVSVTFIQVTVSNDGPADRTCLESSCG